MSVSGFTQLDEMLMADDKKLNRAIHFQIPDEMLISRIMGRLVHPGSGRTYHTEFNPPKVEGIDDVRRQYFAILNLNFILLIQITGEPLTRRSDDNEETLNKRLSAYHTQTEPVIAYYRSTDILSPIDATAKPEIVLDQV